MSNKIFNKKIDRILEDYSYSELAIELKITTWKFCEKLRGKDFTHSEYMKIAKIYRELVLKSNN